ncbi:MAG: hypothetical protein WDW21_03840 [Neisseriaceae bacterium]
MLEPVSRLKTSAGNKERFQLKEGLREEGRTEDSWEVNTPPGIGLLSATAILGKLE